MACNVTHSLYARPRHPTGFYQSSADIQLRISTFQSLVSYPVPPLVRPGDIPSAFLPFSIYLHNRSTVRADFFTIVFASSSRIYAYPERPVPREIHRFSSDRPPHRRRHFVYRTCTLAPIVSRLCAPCSAMLWLSDEPLFVPNDPALVEIALLLFFLVSCFPLSCLVCSATTTTSRPVPLFCTYPTSRAFIVPVHLITDVLRHRSRLWICSAMRVRAFGRPFLPSVEAATFLLRDEPLAPCLHARPHSIRVAFQCAVPSSTDCFTSAVASSCRVWTWHLPALLCFTRPMRPLSSRGCCVSKWGGV